MSVATILNLTLELADDLQQRTLKQSIRAVPLPSGATQGRTLTIPNTSTGGQNVKIISGLQNSVLTVLITDNPVDVQITIGQQIVTWTGVSFPLILPQGVNSIQITNNGTMAANVYVFQGA